MTSRKNITFSFGQNWKNYANSINDTAIQLASEDIDEWLGDGNVEAQRVLDLGSGSGIHSLVLYQKGARELISFDYDPYSVETTRSLWEKAGLPDNWQVMEGSVLDDNFILNLGKFNIVYSWGVLHHTGAMWKAIENALSLVDMGGYLFISIYTKGPSYAKDLALKERYNRASKMGKQYLEFVNIIGAMKGQLKQGKNPFAWNKTTERGMNIYYDIVDWLGGLPYEVASIEEVIEFVEKFGFQLKKLKERREKECSIYLFKKVR